MLSKNEQFERKTKTGFFNPAYWFIIFVASLTATIFIGTIFRATLTATIFFGTIFRATLTATIFIGTIFRVTLTAAARVVASTTCPPTPLLSSASSPVVKNMLLTAEQHQKQIMSLLENYININGSTNFFMNIKNYNRIYLPFEDLLLYIYYS